jgi:hypothetical protein
MKNQNFIIMIIGEDDGLILCDWARKTSAGLLIRDINVLFYTYPHVDHELAPEELSDLLDWMKDLRQTAESSEARTDANSRRLEDKYSAMEKSVIMDTSDAPVGQRACRLPNVSESDEKPTSTKGSSSAKAEEKDENHGYTCIAECLPYKVENNGDTPTASATARTHPLVENIVKFRLESEYVPLMLARPVLACGSMFEILDDRPHGVKVRVTSPDIDKTAYEIGRRLFIRLRSESQSLNPCSPS